MTPQTLKRQLAARGYAICREVVSPGEADPLAGTLHTIFGDGNGSRRILPSHPAVAELLGQDGLSRILKALLAPTAKAVRVLSFDKTPKRNWAVAWHQDRTIAVAERLDEAPVSGWTVKADVPHCEAPAALLDQMLTLRWHLDACGPEQGGLRVLPGSHRLGRLSQAAIRDLRTRIEPVNLDLPAGAVLLMRPLLVHGSPRCTSAGRRRVLHIELADREPPAPLRWAWA